MLRISCTCGQGLKINAAGNLAGKKWKVKCPACAALLLVEVPGAAAVSTKPKRFTARDEDDRPAVNCSARKKTVVPADDEEERPRKKYRDDVEDDDDRPRKRKKKKAQKGTSMLPLVLIGGGALLLLMLVGGGIGAYFLFFKGKKADDQSVAKNGGGHKVGPVAVKFHVPLKVGDVREINATLEKKERSKVIQGPPDMNKNEELKVSFQGKVKTLAINPDGSQTDGEITITSMTVTRDGNRSDFVAAGVVVLQELNDKSFDYRPKDPNVSVPPDVILGLKALFSWEAPMEGLTNDAVYGTSEKKLVGDSWSINKSACVKKTGELFGSDRPTTPLTDAFAGTVKFEGAHQEAGITVLDLKTYVKITMNNMQYTFGDVSKMTVNGTAEINEAFCFPQDYRTGPIKQTGKVVSKGVIEMTGGPVDGTKITGEDYKSWSFTTKYLPNQGAGPGPKKQPFAQDAGFKRQEVQADFPKKDLRSIRVGGQNKPEAPARDDGTPSLACASGLCPVRAAGQNKPEAPARDDGTPSLACASGLCPDAAWEFFPVALQPFWVTASAKPQVNGIPGEAAANAQLTNIITDIIDPKSGSYLYSGEKGWREGKLPSWTDSYFRCA